jgi:integrase
VLKVNVTRKVNVSGRGWRFCKVARGGTGKIKQDTVLVGGQELACPADSLFYIDFVQRGKRTRRAAGATAAEATATAEHWQNELTQQRADARVGIVRPTARVRPTPASDADATGRSLRDAISSYLLEVEAHKKPKTFSAYRTALTYFLESTHKPLVESIERADLLLFKTFLRTKKHQSDRSVANKFENLMTFLKAQDVRIKLSKHDWPVYTQEEVSTYTDDELKKFFAACNETEKLWFRFFYETAMREQEVIHAEWSWIDFENNTATVRENKRFGFKPKAYKGRLIPLKSELLALLKTWKAKSNSTCGLIFPTSGCNPKMDFLDVCKRIAGQAGLTDFYLHKFRATRATHLLQNGMDITSVQKILGHNDLESTQRYLGAQRTELLQAQVEQMASRF